MEVTRTLIRAVVRAFYDTKHVLVMEAILIHSVLPYEDLSFLLGMQTKDMRNLCSSLRKDRLLAVSSRAEIREGMQRPLNKEYCYIDFHATIDAIKYKVYSLTERVKELYKPAQEKKDYYCPRCGAQWTQMEVLDKPGVESFMCHRCGGPLEREEISEGDVTGHEKQTRLMAQLDGFIKMLQKIDTQDVPANDFDKAMAMRVVVERERGNNITVPVANVRGRQVQGSVAGSGPVITPLDVSVISDASASAAGTNGEARRRAEIAQNALPVWHTMSTVTGERTAAPQMNADNQTNGASITKEEDLEEKKDEDFNDELTAYYAQLAQEKERERAAQAEQEAEDLSGEDDDEFEDALAADENQPDSTPSLPHDEKSRDKTEESGSSGFPTHASTPLHDGNRNDSSDEPASKRVKFNNNSSSNDTSTNGILSQGQDGTNPTKKPDPSLPDGPLSKKDNDEDDDDDDEVEFEDI